MPPATPGRGAHPRDADLGPLLERLGAEVPLAPHFVHGVLGAMIGSFQAADCLRDGPWMGGRALP